METEISAARWLIPLMALSAPESADHACVRVPTSSPTVTIDILDPFKTLPVRQLIDVSDSHLLDSHVVSPNLHVPVAPDKPECVPCIVTDTTCEANLLLHLNMLISGVLMDSASVNVPARSPMVNTICPVFCTPLPARHPREVLEPQFVLSHPDPPLLDLAVYCPNPRPAPSNDTNTDPTTPRFAPVIELNAGKSVVKIELEVEIL
jgi:hypothetical protein